MHFNFQNMSRILPFTRTVIALLVLMSLSLVSFSQERNEHYSRAIGGRFGVANGITYKHFLNSNHAVDGILNFQGNRNWSVLKVVGLYEIHDQIEVADYEGLLWYYGAGGGLGFYNNKVEDVTSVAFSLDGVLGLDFKVPTAPINISLDWKPMLELSPNPGLKFDGFGLSIRFAF